MAGEIEFKPLPPSEAMAYFRAKGYKIGFDHRDVEKQEHAYAFTAAKAMRNDILQDIRNAVDKAIADGITYEQFAKDLTPVLQEKGWWGKKKMIDPVTGVEKLAQLGSPRRLKVIFDTNLRSAYSAGTWERIERVKKERPYLRYIAIIDGRTRDQHRQFHDTVLPVDHPFWEKFYPPNGWRCRCSVQQLSEKDLTRLKLKPTKGDPSTPPRDWLNKRTGEIQSVPQGIDPGFDFNPGKARLKSLTPPEVDKPIDVPYSGAPAKAVMPKPRSVSKDMLLPDGLSEKEYATAFLNEFKGKLDNDVFTDVTGEKIVISDDLFKNAKGQYKIKKRDRHRHMRLLANSIQDPDEIWWTWEEYPKGQWTLVRRYISKWVIAGQEIPVVSIFNTTNKGWSGITTFQGNDLENFIKKERVGSLAYKRVGKK